MVGPTLKFPPKAQAANLTKRRNCCARLAQLTIILFPLGSLNLLLQSPALADNAADRTAAKAHRSDYKSLFQRTKKVNRNDADINDPSSLDPSQMDPTTIDHSQDRGDQDQRQGQGGSNDMSADGNHKSDNTTNRPDNSNFNASTDQDTDFSKHSFIDLRINSRPKARDKPLFQGDNEDQPIMANRLKPDSEAGASVTEEPKGKKYDGHFDEPMHLLKAPPEPSPNDWVPSGLDPLQNGGFTIGADNGSPVPYRLNGHVDLERTLPWLNDD